MMAKKCAQGEARGCEFPLPLAARGGIPYLSFGKSDTALPKALNFNLSRASEGAALAHFVHTPLETSSPASPRRIEPCETHMWWLRRSPPFRAPNG